jgi:hypothetical protein
MTCPTCRLLSQFELCDQLVAAEYYADLMLAHEHAKPSWLRINALLHYRFGDNGLKQIQQAAKRIVQRTAA